MQFRKRDLTDDKPFVASNLSISKCWQVYEIQASAAWLHNVKDMSNILIRMITEPYLTNIA